MYGGYPCTGIFWLILQPTLYCTMVQPNALCADEDGQRLGCKGQTLKNDCPREQAAVSDLGAKVELAKHGSVGSCPKFVASRS
jgi:hypothetical protein